MSILAKKTNTPRKTQKNNNLKNTKYHHVNQRGPSFYISLPGGAAQPSITPLLATSQNIGKARKQEAT